MENGLVIKIIGGKYSVLNQATNEEIICIPRGKLRYFKLDKKSSFQESKGKQDTKIVKLSPKVGDYVTYEDNTIYDVLERKNSLVRPDVANIDQVLLIFAAREPEFSFILLDKFITLVEYFNIKSTIIVTKIDLLTNDELTKLKEDLSYYDNIGYDVYFTSVKDNTGIDDIRDIFKDKVSVLAGQTGAGKSSLLNKLDVKFNLKTGEISEALGRGRHTTRHTELLFYNEGYIADTPGFSSLDYGSMDQNDLRDCFIEFDDSSCKFKGCLHIKEPGCRVINEYNKKEILSSRYENYVKFNNEISSKRIFKKGVGNK